MLLDLPNAPKLVLIPLFLTLSIFIWKSNRENSFSLKGYSVAIDRAIAKVSKIFIGSTFNEIIGESKKIFKKNKVFKPSASRKESKESFIVCSMLR